MTRSLLLAAFFGAAVLSTGFASASSSSEPVSGERFTADLTPDDVLQADHDICPPQSVLPYPVDSDGSGAASFTVVEEPGPDGKPTPAVLATVRVKDVGEAWCSLLVIGGPNTPWTYGDGTPPRVSLYGCGAGGPVSTVSNGILVRRVLTDVDLFLVGGVQGLVDELRFGNAFVTVRTNAFVCAELRGQVGPAN